MIISTEGRKSIENSTYDKSPEQTRKERAFLIIKVIDKLIANIVLKMENSTFSWHRQGCPSSSLILNKVFKKTRERWKRNQEGRKTV